MKWFFKICFVLILLGVLGVIFVVNPYLERETIARVEEASGFPAELSYLGFTLKNRGFLIREFELKNPPGYPVETALTVHEVAAVPYGMGFLTREPKFKSMVIDISEINIVTRPDGRNNFKELAANLDSYSKQRPSQPKPSKKPPESEQKAEAQPLQIDWLELRIGKAVMYEFRDDLAEPSVITVNLDVNRTYENVEDLSDVMGDVFASVLQENMKSILGKELGGLFKKLEEKNPETAEEIKQTAEKIGDQLKGLFEGAQ